LISAIPIPDPLLERNKKLLRYDPAVHDYSTEKPRLECIGFEHYVFGNDPELEQYRLCRSKGEAPPLKTSPENVMEEPVFRPQKGWRSLIKKAAVTAAVLFGTAAAALGVLVLLALV
jgi:oligopeptide transport system ATP-binding protein